MLSEGCFACGALMILFWAMIRYDSPPGGGFLAWRAARCGSVNMAATVQGKRDLPQDRPRNALRLSRQADQWFPDELTDNRLQEQGGEEDGKYR